MFGDEALGELVDEIVDDVAEIVVVVNAAGTIRWANQRAAVELGVVVADWIGRPVHERGPSAPDQLIGQADAALYQAKRDGRGRLSRQQIADALAVDTTRPSRN